MTLRVTAVRAAAVVAVTLWIAGPLATALWHWSGDTAIPARPLAERRPETAPPQPDLEPIAVLAPFGRPAPTPEAPQASVPTSRDLMLRGVAISSDPALSAAFIARDGRTERYAAGDAIEPDVTLTAIEPGLVRLDVDGTEELLAFPTTVLPSGDEPAPAEAAQSPLDRLKAAIVAAVPRPETPARAPETTLDYVELWRDRIRRNPGEFLDSIGLVAGDEGYTVAETHDSAFGLVGLKAGDVVRRVNGQQVGDIEEDRRFYDDIAASGLARVEIERGGETMTMSFPLQ